MNVTEEQLSTIVDQVVKQLRKKEEKSCSSPGNKFQTDQRPGVFNTIDQAVEAAKIAFVELGKYSLKDRQQFIDGIREEFRSKTCDFAQEIENETITENKLLNHEKK